MKIVISGGTVIDPASNFEAAADLLIENGKISAVDKPGAFATNYDQLVDARGKWVVPGLIDLHVHLREPGFEWKETIQTGTRAALLGGFTSVCCMPNTNPTLSSAEVLEYVLQQAKKADAARVFPIGSVSLGLEGKTMSPLSELARAGAVAFSDDGEPVWDSLLMRRALEWSAMHGLPITCHEEDKFLSQSGCMNESALSIKLGLVGMPRIAEEVMIARDIELARLTGGKVHICHLSSARGLEMVRRAKLDNINVTCEVTPHHLHLTEERVGNYDTNAKMSPPLRDEEDRQALLRGLSDGTVDAIASDHAPHEEDAKRVEFSKAKFGIIGLQSTLGLTLKLVQDGLLKRSKAVELMTSGPARVFNLGLGSLAKGKPADITVIDPAYKYTYRPEIIASKSKNTPFFGTEMCGVAAYVLVNGKLKVNDQTLQEESL